MSSNQFYPSKDMNSVIFSGYIKDEFEFVANFSGTNIYRTNLGVLRLSGKEDILPIYISDRLEDFTSLKINMYVKVKGSMRSAQYRDDNRIKRTRVYSQVSNILEYSEELPSDWYNNEVSLEGKLFKEPILRSSKTNKDIELTELIIEVHRGYGKYIHIPVIVWGTDAKYISEAKKGSRVHIEGRFQSRYIIRHAKNDEDLFESAMSYEVSARNIDIIN